MPDHEASVLAEERLAQDGRGRACSWSASALGAFLIMKFSHTKHASIGVSVPAYGTSECYVAGT